MSIRIDDGEKNSDELIASLQTELDFYKVNGTAHHQLRDEINNVVRFNKTTTDSGQFGQAIAEAKSDLSSYKEISENIIRNLREQVTFLTNEKSTFQNLWKASQETIANLELEIGEYVKQMRDPGSIFELRQTYGNMVKSLEAKIAGLKNDIAEANTEKMSLEESKRLCEEQLMALDKRHNELTIEHNQILTQMKNTEAQMLRILRERDALERECTLLQLARREGKIREEVVYAKMQEALNVAEIAIAEKTEALKREKDIQDECDQLAITIGRVMEEAGNKVECDIEEIRRKYKEKIKCLEDTVKRMIASNDTEVQKHRALDAKIEALEIQLEQSHRISSNLDQELQIASKTIIELEIKLNAMEKLVIREQETNKTAEDREQHLRELFHTNKQLKQKLKEAFAETTEKLQRELKNVQIENKTIVLENQRLKNKLAKYE